jgi:hypothetical protein
MSEDLLASGCTNVGLRIDSHDPEYFFWYLLDAPQSGIRLENVNPLPTLERYQDPTFKPCAVICTLNTDLPSMHGLPIFREYGDIKLYLE